VQFPVLSDETSGWIAAAFGVCFTVWKIFLRVRSDAREDKKGSEQQSSYSDLLHEYQEQYNLLKSEADRLNKLYGVLTEALDAEINRRRMVERECAEKQRVIDSLEDQIRRMGK
jgi:hypothetical protein